VGGYQKIIIFRYLLKERTNPNENWADSISAATQGLSGVSIPKNILIFHTIFIYK
jgi:hypothetical protein